MIESLSKIGEYLQGPDRSDDRPALLPTMTRNACFRLMNKNIITQDNKVLVFTRCYRYSSYVQFLNLDLYQAKKMDLFQVRMYSDIIHFDSWISMNWSPCLNLSSNLYFKNPPWIHMILLETLPFCVNISKVVVDYLFSTIKVGGKVYVQELMKNCKITSITG
jgi:hypothetical protein